MPSVRTAASIFRTLRPWRQRQ